MVARDVEEKLRKLSAISKREAELAWLHYLSGEGPERAALGAIFEGSRLTKKAV